MESFELSLRIAGNIVESRSIILDFFTVNKERFQNI